MVVYIAKSTLVSIVNTSDPAAGPKKALDMIGAGGILSKYERVLIKPNYVNASHPSTGVTTDPRVVRSIVEYLIDKGWSRDEFAVAEGGMVNYNTMDTSLMGLEPADVLYLKLAKKAGLGENELEKIEYAGEEISKLRKRYRM